MKPDSFAPEEKVGDVIGDLNRRRGVIEGQEGTPGGIRVKAEAPSAPCSATSATCAP